MGRVFQNYFFLIKIKFGHEIPSLNNYYYRVRHLDEGILKLLLEKVGQYLAGKNKDKILCYIADATGFAYGDIYNLNWRRGTEIRSVKSFAWAILWNFCMILTYFYIWFVLIKCLISKKLS
jgi:hypothetical protein